MALNRRGLLFSAAASLTCYAAAAAPSAATVSLQHPDGRETAYRMMAPDTIGRWPIVLFSHGANSSNTDYDRIWRPWAARGYLVIGANHLDTGPAESQPKIGRDALWRSRVADMALPLNQRTAFDAYAQSRGAVLDWSAVGAAGHSFGAVVAQALAGATITNPVSHTPFEGRAPVSACIVLSPPGPLAGYIPLDSWRSVTAPSFLQTGDADILPGFVDDWRLRLTGFAGAPERWTLVGRGVNHYFGGLICRLRPGATADLKALDETTGLTADFLDAYLRKSKIALRRLQARAALGDDGVASFAAV